MDFRNPNVTYSTQLDMPAAFMWNLISDFGGWMKFNPVLSKVTVQECHSTFGKDPTVCRDVETIFGQFLREELVTKDASTFTLAYKLGKWEKTPPIFDRFETQIQLIPIDQGHCTMSWKANIVMVKGTPLETFQGVLARQKMYYRKTTSAAVTHLYIQVFTKDAMKFLTEKSLEVEAALLLGNGAAPNTYEYDEYGIDQTKWPLPKMCKGLPLREALPPKKIGTMVARVLELGYLQAAKFLLDHPEAETEKGRFDYEGAARKLASTYGNDREKDMTAFLLNNWDTDEEFCQQYLQGVNPLLIEVVSTMQQIPQKMRYLSVRDPGNKTKSVQSLIDEKRLFIIDYKDLEQFNHHKNLYFYAPILVVYKKIQDDGETRLDILAIQVEREENSPIYTPDTPHKNRYKLAKMFVACADIQVHQFGYHLAISHLGNEPVSVAINRKLPEGHALKDLLLPHFKDTIGINFGARLALVTKPEQAFTNSTFAVGTEQGRQLASVIWQKFDFFDYSFPKELEKRGFYRDGRDGLGDYFYRDDGFKVWDAIGNYCQNFVYRHYKNDQDVANDKDLQAFCYDLSAKEFGNYPGFPTQILTRDLLFQCLQIIIWNAGPLHSFLNYPQWPYVGFIKNRHNALYKPMPKEDGKDVDDDYIDETLAPTFGALFQLTFCWLLTCLDDDQTLVTLKSLKNTYPDIDNRLQIELQEVTKQIERRNDKLIAEGRTPYVFLLPENVASSCNI
jgi:arachidonate 5-lipoxygenase